MNIPSGTALGSIVIDEKIESGGEGEIYLGHQPALGRNVRVRELPTEPGRPPG